MSETNNNISNKVGYRDSRRAAFRILQPGKRHALRRFLLFVFVTAGAIGIWRELTQSLPADQRSVLFLFLLAVGLWITEAVPAFAVGLLIMGYLVFALGTELVLDAPVNVDVYLNTWSSPVIWLMLGGFFLAEGLSRTGLDRRIFSLAIKPAGSNPKWVLLAIMLTSAVASMFISNTSTAALMVGAVLPLIRQMGRREAFGKALLIAIPVAASVGGMGTIIGSAPNAIAAGVANEAGASISFIEWMMLGVPVSLLLVVIAWYFLLKRYPTVLTEIKLDLSSLDEPELPMKRDRVIVASIAIVTVIMWMTTTLHGIHVVAISLIPIVGLTMTQVMGAAHVRRLPWDTLMLVAGGLSLGSAVVDTGLAERLAGGLGFLTALNIDLIVFAVLALITVALSNVMSNTATVSVVLPVAVALLPGREMAMCVILGLSASCALLLPVSTPPNAIAFSTGELETRDLRPGGILIGLLGPVLIISWVLLVVWLIME